MPRAALGETFPSVLCTVQEERYLALLEEHSVLTHLATGPPAFAMPCAPPVLGEDTGPRPSPWPTPLYHHLGYSREQHYPEPGCLLRVFSITVPQSQLGISLTAWLLGTMSTKA